MAELKPCPFCGGEAELKSGRVYIAPIVFCRCRKCLARTEVVYIDHPRIDVNTGRVDESTRYTEWQAKKRAIEAWNRRAGEQDG